MRITTEASLRRIVRRIMSEAKDTEETVTVTNSTKTKITVSEVYTQVGGKFATNLITASVDIEPGANADVKFTPTTADTAFIVYADRFQGTGVTKGYRRRQYARLFTSGEKITFVEPVSNADVDSVYSDTEQMDDVAIDALLQPGEEYEIIEDPTDPEFSYAVIYVKTPTRAVVVRAPAEDYKGDKIVSSKGQEISPRRYGGSFRKIADAFVEMKKTP